MTAIDDFERRLSAGLADLAPRPADGLGTRVMAIVDATEQTMPGRWSRGGWQRPGLLLAAALVTVAMLGAVAVGSGLLRVPDLAPTPVPRPAPSEAARQSDLPTTPPAVGRVVYQRHTQIANGQEGACVTPSGPGCTQWSTIFVANDDGSEPRELTPNAWDAEPVALSPDGTHLIVRVMAGEPREDHHYLTDLNGSGLELLDTGCETPCVADWGFAFSPDGERLAFIRSFGSVEPSIEITESVLAIMDWATGDVVELDSTRAHPSADFCPEGCPVGSNESPRWSPNGAQLLFTRSGLAGPADPAAFIGVLTFIVDDDGGNLRQLVPLELFARDAQWSSDGARIVFTSATEGATEDQAFYGLNDIYTVRPDGTQLTRLTRYSEGPIQEYQAIGAQRPNWTRDGRIVFVLIPRGEGADAPAQAWIMDADGTNAVAISPADAATFTSLGCMTCPYPLDAFARGSDAIWLPRP